MQIGKAGPLFQGLQPTDQHPGDDVQPTSDLQDVVQRDVPAPTFHLAEVRPVQPAALSGLLLAQPQGGRRMAAADYLRGHPLQVEA